MKIIVCGAGSVGRSIVAYLSRGSNDIIVIDTDSHKLDEISKEWDIQPINGSASHPDVLEKAGARSADMIIAATDRDEVNLVTCQVAHSLFNVPKKIARIDSASFLSPQWNMLYNEENIPVDLVISPEIEIGKAILEKKKLTDDIIERAARLAEQLIAPISDQRASAEYRKEMVYVNMKDMIREAAAKIG